MTAPPPAGARGNDWRSLPVTPVEFFEPDMAVTVVVPYFEAPEALALTLAGLEGQTYPRELFEVVVVDDGSDPPLELAQPESMRVRVIHQEDLGFGLARARNNGARAATGDIIVFLDCDMVPEAEWLAFHARWHHAACDLVTLGFRRHVDFEGIDADAVRGRPGSLEELLAERPVQHPEWIERRMTRTDDLTADSDDIFRVVTGGNFGISAAFFADVGMFDESFTQWGAEDIEFGWRAYALGAVLAPERGALCWHQGPGAVLTESETVSLEQQRDKVSHLIPDRRLRSAAPGRSFTVPQIVVTVDPGHADPDVILATVEQVLASDVHDLVVWVEERPEERFERLHRLLDPDPRAEVGAAGGAAGAHRAAAFFVRVPAGADVVPRMIGQLRQQLGSAASGQSDLASGHRVTITRAWALNRSQRCNLAISDVGDVVELDVDSLRVTQEPQPQSRLAARLQGPVKILLRAWTRFRRHLATVFGTARRIRSLTDVGRFIAMIVRAVWWRLRNVRWRLRRVRKRLKIWLGLQAKSRRYVPRLARYPLGAEITASGRVASAVLAASARVASPTGDHHVDIVLVDSTKAAHAVASGSTLRSGPVVAVLDELSPRISVQAFDAEAVNPVGWSAAHEPGSATLRSQLPSAGRGVFSHRIGGDVLKELRSLHHLEDRAAFHRSAPQRAAALAALAAAGVLVRVPDPDADLKACLGKPLHDLLAGHAVAQACTHEREMLSIAMRRCALRDHSLRSRARQILGATGLDAPGPEVSILAPTRRPERLGAVIDTVRSQTYPRLELVLALHGDGFAGDSEIAALTGALQHRVQVVRVDADKPLGAVLNAAVEASSGGLLTKMDDDDFYGPEHVWDLVLAHEYSRAELVGKSAEYVYLERLDKTVRDAHRQRFSERFIPFIGVSGGVLIIARHDLDAAGGWRRVPRRVDIALAQDVAAVGGRIYWTHGAGYLRVRHGDEHTWTVDDSHFLGRASETRDGLDLTFAGISSTGTSPP